MINADAPLREPGPYTPAHQPAPTQVDVIAQHAAPEDKVDFTLPNGQVTTMRLIRWKPSKVFQRMPEIGSILAVPMAMAGNESIEPTERNAQVLSVLFSGLDQRNMYDFMQSLLDQVYTLAGENVSEHFDAVFMAHPALVVQIAAKVLEINYGPFLQIDLKGIFSTMQAITQLSS